MHDHATRGRAPVSHAFSLLELYTFDKTSWLGWSTCFVVLRIHLRFRQPCHHARVISGPLIRVRRMSLRPSAAWPLAARPIRQGLQGLFLRMVDGVEGVTARVPGAIFNHNLPQAISHLMNRIWKSMNLTYRYPPQIKQVPSPPACKDACLP